jgi:TetR/AcrR family transcriptional regulator, lmrAB and yxaGH operons repressor
MEGAMPTHKPEDGGTRQRIVDASAELFGRQGFSGTGLKAIVASSHAPFGSLYHFFPGGKEELGVAALRASGEMYRGLVLAFFGEGCDVEAATRGFFEGAAAVVEMTDFADACPIATVALEVASTSEPMRQAAAEAFESWLGILEQRFAAAGMSPTRAREVAVELFCAIEGAFLLSRTIRSIEPIMIAGRAGAATVAAALPPRGT